MLVYIKSPPSIPLHKPPPTMLGDGGLGFLHPQFSCGHNVRTVYVNTQTTCAEIISTISDATGLSAITSSQMRKKREKTDDKSDDKTDVIELGNQLSLAAGQLAISVTLTLPIASRENTLSLIFSGILAKDKRQKDTVNAQKAARPPTRRGTIGHDLTSTTSSFHVPSSRASLALFHDLLPVQPLPNRLTLAQLMVLLEERGQSLSFPYLALTIKNKNSSEAFQEGSYVRPCLRQGATMKIVKFLHSFRFSGPSKGQDEGEIPEDVLLGCASLPTTLQIFASMGGLSLLAQHLPLLYPEISRQISPKLSADKLHESSKQVSSLDSEWVKVEGPDDMFDVSNWQLFPLP